MVRHRFDQHGNPVVGACLTWHAINLTAERIWMSRRSGGRDGLRDLAAFSGNVGMERSLMLGMVGDMAVEGYGLTLFNDTEKADSALLATYAAHYVHALNVVSG